MRSRYSLVSSGTERLVARGEVPAEVAAQMQVPYMEGSFDFPVKYGYSLVAVVETPDHPLAGQTVHLLHPHQDYCQVADTDLFVVPPGVPARRATLASNLETALNAVWDGQVSVGDRVLVVGFGLIGSLVARLLSMMPAVEVSVWEVDEARQAAARAMGFVVARPQSGDPPADVAFHCSASAAGLQVAIDAVGFEGRVVELSWYGVRETGIRLGGSFHSQRKQLVSSQVSHLPADRRSRWDDRRRKTTVFALLHDPVFDRHLPGEVAFGDLPRLFDRLRTTSDTTLAWTVHYDPPSAP
ncbi:MAG: zinc-binding alcohol dehydrogenase [Bacteroidia bacterium]